MSRFRPRTHVPVADTSSQAHEDRVAAAARGKRQRGSGSSMYAKGDVTAAAYLIECKTTDAASLRITRKWLAKITREANAVQKVPALAFAIQGGRDDTATGALLEADWVCVPLSEWKRLTGGGA